MKDGLDEAALAQMKRAFAGQQPFPQEGFRRLQAATLHEAARIRHQHVLHIVGMIEKIHVLAAHLEMDDVAIAFGQPEENTGRITPQGEQEARLGQSARAGRGIEIRR